MRRKTYEKQEVEARRLIDVWRQRSRGVSVVDIAEEYGVTRMTVHNWIQKAAELFEIEAAQTVIKMEVERLDILLSKAMSILESKFTAYSNGIAMINSEGEFQEDPMPVLHAIDRVLKIMDRRSKFLGLDAPTKSEQQINVFSTSSQDLELKTLLEQARSSLSALTPQALAPALPSQPEHEVYDAEIVESSQLHSQTPEPLLVSIPAQQEDAD